MTVESGICDLSWEPVGFCPSEDGLLWRLGQAPPVGSHHWSPWLWQQLWVAPTWPKGELSRPQVVLVLFVQRPVDVPPQNPLLETPADNDLEHTKVTPKVVLDRSRLLCSQPPCQVSRQAILQVCKLRPARVRWIGKAAQLVSSWTEATVQIFWFPFLSFLWGPLLPHDRHVSTQPLRREPVRLSGH